MYLHAVHTWDSITFTGSWTDSSAGGCRNNANTFHHNPQFFITLEDDINDDGKCTVMVALMQSNLCKQKSIGAKNLTIGFALYKVWLLIHHVVLFIPCYDI